MLSLFLGVVCLQAPPTPETIQDLIRQVPRVTVSRDRGISKEQEALAERFQNYGALAIPELLPLLEDPDEIVRGFIGYALRDIKGLEEKHLDALIRARQGGNGWIPPAIAHVGTPRAIEFLVADLQAQPQTHTQVTWALCLAGEKAAIALADSFRSSDPLDERYAECVCFVFKEMGERAAPACERLVEIARGAGFQKDNRKLAVEAIGGLGPLAQRVVPELQALAGAEPELFGGSVEFAILGIGGPEAAAILAKELGGGIETCTLRDLAALGDNGFEAGPAVLERLAAPDADVRVAAAKTLGYIGYFPAIEPLVRETMQSDDWRLAFAAVESLGRLRATRALAVLQSVAASYWYPPVRTAAKHALAVLHGTAEYASLFHRKNFAFEFFGYSDRERFDDTKSKMPRLSAGPDELTAAELKRNTYIVELRGSDDRGERVTHRIQEPQCGLRVANGLLVGASRGEWGGEVALLRRGFAQQTVLSENLRSLHRTPSGIIAVTGLAHMSMNDGALYRIEPTPGGSYKAIWWRRLPGEPQRSGFDGDGALFIRCLGGDVVLTPDGQLRMAGAR